MNAQAWLINQIEFSVSATRQSGVIRVSFGYQDHTLIGLTFVLLMSFNLSSVEYPALQSLCSDKLKSDSTIAGIERRTWLSLQALKR